MNNEKRPKWELQQERAAKLDALNDLAKIASSRALTEVEREKVKQNRDQIELIDIQVSRMEAEKEAVARQHGGKAASTKDARALVQAVREFRGKAGSERLEYNPQAFYRAMTPASNSAGKSAYTGTSSLQLTQTENLDWLQMLNLTSVERNGQIVPFISRGNRLTAQTKGYTDELNGQAYVVDAYTVSFSNYYTYLEVHNDVLRDASDAALEGVLFEASRADIIRQVAKDVLLGATGGNNLVGVASTTGVQTVTGGGVVIADYSLIVEAVQKLMTNAETNPENIAVIMHPKVWEQFANLTATGDGQPLQRPNQIANIPFYPYSRIPVNQGTSTDETTIFVGDLSKWNLYADGFYDVASQSGPNMKRDYTDIVITYRADLATIDPASMCLITGVQAV